MILGLTGGIASGKSTVATMLVARGAYLVDADQIARDVVRPGSSVLAEIASHFHQKYQRDVLMPDGSLHRKALGEIVFTDEQAKRELEAMIHPPIRATITATMEKLAQEHPNSLIVVDIPLLFESKYDYMFSEVMLVYVPREVQLQRLKIRDGISDEAAEQRLSAQMPIEEKRKLATLVIDNSGDLVTTEQQIAQFWRNKGLDETET